MNLAKVSKPILWSYYLSTCSWRVRIALNLKNIDYEYQAVDLLNKSGGYQFSPQFTILNPKQEVPLLLIDDHLFTQSIPIIEYLDSTRKRGKKLLPENPSNRVKSRIIAEIINSGIQPYQNANVIKKINLEMGKSKRIEWLNKYLNKGLNAVEIILKDSKGRYCVGDEVSLADLCLVPQIFAAKRYNIDMKNFPLIDSVISELNTLPEFLKAMPQNQPDFLEN